MPADSGRKTVVGKAETELRKRNRGRGDYEAGSPLADVVDRFRQLAGLHLNAPDQALVLFAHGPGRDRPGATEVRDMIASIQNRRPESPQEVPVKPRGTQAKGEGPLSLQRSTSEEPTPTEAAEPTHEPPWEEATPRASMLACPHNCQALSRDQQVVCLDCGEVIRERVEPAKTRPAQVDIHSPLFTNMDKHTEIQRGRIEVREIEFEEEIEDDEVLF